jgi:hypothetical protein
VAFGHVSKFKYARGSARSEWQRGGP